MLIPAEQAARHVRPDPLTPGWVSTSSDRCGSTLSCRNNRGSFGTSRQIQHRCGHRCCLPSRPDSYPGTEPRRVRWRSGHCRRQVTVIVTLFHPDCPVRLGVRAPPERYIAAVGVVEGADHGESQEHEERMPPILQGIRGPKVGRSTRPTN